MHLRHWYTIFDRILNAQIKARALHSSVLPAGTRRFAAAANFQVFSGIAVNIPRDSE